HTKLDREPVDTCEAIELARDIRATHSLAKQPVEFGETPARKRHCMADDFMRDVRLGRIKRCGMVTNVLRGKKDSACERLEKHTRLNQSRHRLEPEAADRFHLAAYFIQLRNVIGVKSESLKTIEILGTGMRAMRRSERFPNFLPNTVLKIGIRRGRNR